MRLLGSNPLRLTICFGGMAFAWLVADAVGSPRSQWELMDTTETNMPTGASPETAPVAANNGRRGDDGASNQPAAGAALLDGHVRRRRKRRPIRGEALKKWLLADLGAAEEEAHGHFSESEYEKEHLHPWWQVMCLTGVDYFSTLGYQPGIAFLAAGVLSPIATIILVLVTLFGALPIYNRVSQESPHGEGSIAMLRNLLPAWKGKLFVLALLGFAATDFIITITLSAADATAHLIQNPLMPGVLQGQKMALTLLLIAVLGGVFLKGFNEAIGLAVALVVTYLALNAVVVAVGLLHVVEHPSVLSDWTTALFQQHGNPALMVGVSLLLFPKLALGLSGFETGVAVMPLLKGDPGDDDDKPVGRIRNARKLLTVAALIMSVFLITSSIVTTTLIPAQEFAPGGEANGRALAYLAHQYLGSVFGTVYDLSTCFILWFAGASSMAGLLNLVPNYLPRFGMAPAWAAAARPLVLVFTAIGLLVTIIFNADVDAQGGAYATGVLVLMTSAAIAVALSFWRDRRRGMVALFVVVTLVFIYTTIINVVERPDGVKIASIFISAIIVVSFISRAMRSTELRASSIAVTEGAKRLIDEAVYGDTIRIIANEPNERTSVEYAAKEWEERTHSSIPDDAPVLFLEVTVHDASEFAPDLEVTAHQVGTHRIIRAEAASVGNAIAALLLWIRNYTGKVPHCYFAWTEGHPLTHALRFLILGEGEIAPITREILREAEPDPRRRPAIHVG